MFDREHTVHKVGGGTALCKLNKVAAVICTFCSQIGTTGETMHNCSHAVKSRDDSYAALVETTLCHLDTSIKLNRSQVDKPPLRKQHVICLPLYS